MKEVRQEEKEYKSDGKFTKEERKDVHQDLNAVSKEIYKEKHDAQTQPGVTPNTPGNKDPGVNKRQDNQHDRIVQGVKSGELTKAEAQSLRTEEKAIRLEEKEYKSDGKLTKDERKDLHQDLNEASKDIYNQKHDDDERAKAANP